MPTNGVHHLKENIDTLVVEVYLQSHSNTGKSRLNHISNVTSVTMGVIIRTIDPDGVYYLTIFKVHFCIVFSTHIYCVNRCRLNSAPSCPID